MNNMTATATATENGIDNSSVLEQLAPDICRMLAETSGPASDIRLREMLRRVTDALGADDACMRCLPEDGGAVTHIATSDGAATLSDQLAESTWFSRQLLIGGRIVLARGAA